MPIKLFLSENPRYIFSICFPASTPRELSSFGFYLLSLPKVISHGGVIGDFSIADPTLMNSLTEHVTSSNSIVSFSPFENNPSYVFTTAQLLLTNSEWSFYHERAYAVYQKYMEVMDIFISVIIIIIVLIQTPLYDMSSM